MYRISIISCAYLVICFVSLASADEGNSSEPLDIAEVSHLTCFQSSLDYQQQVMNEMVTDCKELYARIDEDPSSFTFGWDHLPPPTSARGSFSHGYCDIEFHFIEEKLPDPTSVQLWEWMQPIWLSVTEKCLNVAKVGAWFGNKSTYAPLFSMAVADPWSDDESMTIPLLVPLQQQRPAPQALPMDIILHTHSMPFGGIAAEKILKMLALWNNKSPCSKLCDPKEGLSRAHCNGVLEAMENLAADFVAWQLFWAAENSALTGAQASVVIGNAIYKGLKVVRTLSESYEAFEAFADQMSQDDVQQACIKAKWKVTKGALSGIEALLLIAAGAEKCETVLSSAAAGGILTGLFGMASAVVDVIHGWCIYRKASDTASTTLFISQTALSTTSSSISPTSGQIDPLDNVRLRRI